MSFPMKFLTSLLLLPIACVATEPKESALQGCWRSQQMHMTLADHSQRDQNSDCVTEYDGTHAKTRCHFETGDREFLSSYEFIEPGQLRVTPLDAVTGKPNAAPIKLNYRIDDEWLLIERQYTDSLPSGSNNKQPTNMKSVLIRVHPGIEKELTCKPHGANPLRIGRTPVSSLALTMPIGWEPWLIDPASDNRLGPAVNTSFFIGAFVPSGTGSKSSSPSQLVLVLDDVRYGASPVRSREFASVKKRFAAELGTAQLTCDLPDRSCALLRLPDGGQVYTELINVKGRVAMISSSVARPDVDSSSLLRKSVQMFVDRLRLDNLQ